MKCAIFLANGFEDCEALVTIDMLRRADVEVDSVSITDDFLVQTSHGVRLYADRVWKRRRRSGSLRPPVGLPETESRRHPGMQPFAQRGDRCDICGDYRIEVREQPVLVEEFGTARLFGEATERIEKRVVLAHGLRRMRNVAVDYTAADEYLARLGKIEPAEVAAA